MTQRPPSPEQTMIVTASKVTSPASARDATIAASLLLQHGCHVEALRRALTRKRALDLLDQQTNKADACEQTVRPG